eukprot:6454638-Amphidinium_carterae.1
MAAEGRKKAHVHPKKGSPTRMKAELGEVGCGYMLLTERSGTHIVAACRRRWAAKRAAKQCSARAHCSVWPTPVRTALNVTQAPHRNTLNLPIKQRT